MLLKSKKSKQRIVERKKVLFDLINCTFLSPTTWGVKNFWDEFLVKFKKSKQRKSEGYKIVGFAGYLLEGLLISCAKFSEKVSNE